MSRCASCFSELSHTTRDRAYPGPVAFCTACPRSNDYLWGEETVASGTGWAGGRVTGEYEAEDGASGVDEFDPRDEPADFGASF